MKISVELHICTSSLPHTKKENMFHKLANSYDTKFIEKSFHGSALYAQNICNIELF